MKLLLRAAELIVALLLVAWTVIFPVATLLSLVITLPMIALVAWAAPVRGRAGAT
jgi:hypothetical protein